MKRFPWMGVLIGCLAFVFLAVLPLRIASGQQAGTITPSPTRSHTRWPTVTRRPTDTRWPVPPTHTRWPVPPTHTRWPVLATATRWPTVTRQPTATRWPSPIVRPTSTRWPSLTARPTSTRWPTVTRGPTTTRQPTSTRTLTLTRTLTPTVTPVSNLTLGPFGVVLVQSNDVLNIRSGAGVGYATVGSFTYNANNVMRTGNNLSAGGATWYQVQNPSGGTGWVNSYYLTEYVPSGTFCADARVQALFVQVQQAVNASNGSQLAGLVNPVHGLDVRFWHNAAAVNFTPAQVAGLFTSTTQQNWGAGPSAIDTVGTFAGIVQPELQAVLNAPYDSFCNNPNVASMYSQPWPFEYTNINYYSLFKPGTPGIDLDYKQWMVGIEYVLGRPFLVSMMHIVWEP